MFQSAKLEGIDQFVYQGTGLSETGLRRAAASKPVGYVVVDPEMRKQVVLLGEITHPAAVGRDPNVGLAVVDHTTPHLHPALQRPKQPGNGPKDSGLASA